MALTEQRKGEIALLVLKERIRRDPGSHLPQSTIQQIDDITKHVGIPIDEADEFAELIARELMEELLLKRRKTP